MLLLVLALGASALQECKSIQGPGGIPCRVSTTWDPGNCIDFNVTIFNSSGDNLTTFLMSEYGSTGFCQFSFNFTTRGTYPYNITTGDTGSILVEGADEMASLSVVAFLMMINIGVFWLPSKLNLVGNSILNNILKKMMWIAGLALLALNMTIVRSIADSAGLGINTELFFYVNYFLWGIYFAIIFLFWNMMVSTMQMTRLKKAQKRMGEDEEA